MTMALFWDAGHLGKGNNFNQKLKSPFGRPSFLLFGRVKLFLPAEDKNLMVTEANVFKNYMVHY